MSTSTLKSVTTHTTAVAGGAVLGGTFVAAVALSGGSLRSCLYKGLSKLLV